MASKLNKVVEPGRKAWRQIRNTFGSSVLEEDGQLNRKKLGQIIFGDAEKRAKLNAITHPAIAKEIFFSICYYLVRGGCVIYFFRILVMLVLKKFEVFVGLSF